MKSKSKQKTSAEYQREFRQRLRDKGLIKKEVWILPEYTKQLSVVEKQLRILGQTDIQGGVGLKASEQWTSIRLFETLQGDPLFTCHNASLELIDGAEPALYILMHDYGDLPLFLTVSGEQIIVECMLWPASNVINERGFNDAVLRTHKYFPLSTISLEHGPDGEDYYYMFGALSATSALANIVHEIDVLSGNVIQAASAYEEFLNLPEES